MMCEAGHWTHLYLQSPVTQEAAQLLGHLLPDVQHHLLDTELPLTLTQATII